MAEVSIKAHVSRVTVLLAVSMALVAGEILGQAAETAGFGSGAAGNAGKTDLRWFRRAWLATGP